MPSHPFEAALSQPESDVPHAQLVTLLSDGDFSDSDLATIAENYLIAFCNPNRSTVRRRWIGITLTRMLEKSDCVARTLRLSEPLKNLGAIITSHEEQGVVKIIAGLIMRQGLKQNIEYHRFWPTEKPANSALRFPQRSGPEWMRDFHAFLDSFGEPTVTDVNNKTYIGYIASIVTSDGFARGGPGNDISAAILETGMLTIVVSDAHLETCHFVDIPVSHIISTRSERPMVCESCSVILSLKSEPWAYYLNSAQRTATEISLVFKQSENAVQWQDYIQQYQKAYEDHHRICHISPVDTNPSLARQDRQQKSPSSRSSHSLAEQSGVEKYSKPRHKFSPPKAHAQPRRSSSQTSIRGEDTISAAQFRRIECSKERQTRAPRAAKQNALKKLGLQSSVNGHGQKRGRQQRDSDASGATSSAKGEESSKNTKSGNLHVGNTVKDDEEHAATPKRLKKQASTKRKVDVQLVKDGEQTKRSRIQSDSFTDMTVTAETGQARSRILTKAFSSALSSRHSLIEGLKASQELSDSDASFKKPTLPAHNARSPSTPAKPKQKVVETRSRLQTPRDPRSFYGDIFSQMPSSPPIPCQPDEGVGWSRETAAEAVILSSNSKPVPASPNAESTAISGHADSDDVALEKQTGDSQIAISDPFTRRSKGGKVTSFLRRLTGEEPADVASDLGTDVSQTGLARDMNFSTSRLDDTATMIEPLPQLISGQEKTNHLTLACMQEMDGDLGMESDILNGDVQEDQQHSSESDLPPVYFSSSPPRLGSLTSNSSTSATPLPSSQYALLSSEANEIHWEMSPESHQRNLHHLLACTSEGIAATDSVLCGIAETFVKDSNCVLQSLSSQDNNDHERVFIDMEAKREALGEELECATELRADDGRKADTLV